MNSLTKPILLLLAVVVLSSCRDKVEESWEVNTPIYMSYDELRTSFKIAPGQDIKQSGKLYFKGDYIFVNEYQKGIHVIDNEDPSNPVVLKFIEIPGNVDLAIAGNILYADSYIDLISLDITDINNIVIVDRDSNAFPYIIPEVEEGFIEEVDQNKGVVVGYKVTIHTEEVDISEGQHQRFPMWESFSTNEMVRSDAIGSAGSKSFGVGGSMARFTLYDTYLYTISNSSLKLFNISKAENPE